MTNQNHPSISNIGPTSQTSETSNDVPPAGSGPLSESSPLVAPDFSSVLTPIEPSSSVESDFVQPEHIWHPLGSSRSSFITDHSDISPRVTLVLDAPVTTSSNVLSARDNTRSTAQSVSMEVSRHEKEPVSLNPDIPEHPSTFGDHAHD